MAVDYHKKGHVAIFTLNRPEVLNAVNSDVFKELNTAVEDFRDDPEVWVGIITGAGERAFCAGADLKAIGSFRNISSGNSVFGGFLLTHQQNIFKPLIAAINGYCLGAGLEIALACDIRIIADHARLGMPEATRGIVPQEGGTQRLPRMLNWCQAAELLFTGKHIDANEAYRIGLVNKIVPLEQLMPTALEWAENMCQLAPLALRAIKEAMLRGILGSLEDGLVLERSLGASIRNTEDYVEGRRAFIENRKPKYQGR